MKRSQASEFWFRSMIRFGVLGLLASSVLASAQQGGGRADPNAVWTQACERSLGDKIHNDRRDAGRVQSLYDTFREWQESNGQTGVSGKVQYDRKGNWTRVNFRCMYNVRYGRVDSISYSDDRDQGYGNDNGYGKGDNGYGQGYGGRGGYRVSSRAQQRDFGGGSGGRKVTDAKCDSGYVATGFHVKTGEFYNEVWVDCAGLRPDGSLDSNTRMTNRSGAPGGRDEHDARCGYGQVMVGLKGRAAASIDEAAGKCMDPRDVSNNRSYPRTELTNAITIPHPGGRPAEVQCPSGQVMVGLRTKSGEWIDHMWILCADLDRGRDR